MTEVRAQVLNSLKQMVSANLLSKKEQDTKSEALDHLLKTLKPA